MPVITNFGDVTTQGNTTITGNVTVQGTGTSSFSSASSAVTLAGTLAVTGTATHTGNVIPSGDLVSNIGTQTTRFIGVYTSNANVYTTANILAANVLTLNVYNVVYFSNTTYHVGPTILTGNTTTLGVIVPSATGQSGLGTPGQVFANAWIQTANIGSAIAQQSMNVIGNVFISNSINVTNVLSVTTNASYLNVLTYANISQLNVFTGANVTYLNVMYIANVNNANVLTTNVQSANIVFANVQNLNVSTGANVSYLNVTYIANVNNANVLTTNIQSANIVFANVQNLNVSTGANVSYLNVAYIANVNTANVLTINNQSANIVFANVQNLNVSTGANVSYLNVSYIANVNTANVLTINNQSANIVFANVQNLNVSTGANVSYLNVTYVANVNNANVLTLNVQTSNLQTANIVNLNVSSGANISYLNVFQQANVFNANVLTMNSQTANIVFANVQNLNVSTGANVSYLNVTYISNVNNANVLTLNVQTSNLQTANIVNLNVSSGANISYLNVFQQANIITANIVTALHSNLNVSSNANVFNANIYTGNVQTTFNVSGLLSGTLHTGNGSALSNMNASNLTQGLLNFSSTALGGLTGIRINGVDGTNGQFLTSTGGTTVAGVQWGGPSATVIWTQVTSTTPYPIYYNLANVGIGQTGTWASFGAGYNAYPGAPLDVYGGSGAVSFSSVSDATYSGIIRIQCSSSSYAAVGGLEFKTGANAAGTGHRLMTAELTSSSGIAPLIFQYRANSPTWSSAMTIQNGGGTAGYVGIGTTGPLFNLHVYQLSGSAAAIATVQASSTGQYSQLALANSASGTAVFYLNGSTLSTDGPANSATLRNNVGDLRLAAQSTSPFIYLQNSSGNVGVGLTQPQNSLDVNTSFSVSFGNQPTTGYLRFVSTTSVNYVQSGLSSTSGSAAPLVFTTVNAGTEWMRLTSSGFLGIGTNSVSNKLDVWGTSGNVAVARFYGVGASCYVYHDNDNAANQTAIQFNKAGTMYWVNYVPGSSSDIRWNNSGGDRMTLTSAGALSVTGSVSCTSVTGSGTIQAPSIIASGAGQVALVPGGASNPGYVAIYNPSNTRVGYIGWQAATNYLSLETENGYAGYNVTGNLLVNGVAGVGGLTSVPTSPVLWSSKDVTLTTGNYAGDVAAQIIATGYSNSNKRLALMYDTTNNIGLVQAMIYGTGTSPLILNAAGGNVGIATTSPQAPLHIGSGTDAYAQGMGLLVTTYGSGSWINGCFGPSGGAKLVVGYLNGVPTIGAHTATLNGWNNLCIQQGGSVGIGNTNPSYTLDVNGTFRCYGSKIIVQNSQNGGASRGIY